MIDGWLESEMDGFHFSFLMICLDGGSEVFLKVVETNGDMVKIQTRLVREGNNNISLDEFHQTDGMEM